CKGESLAYAYVRCREAFPTRIALRCMELDSTLVAAKGVDLEIAFLLKCGGVLDRDFRDIDLSCTQHRELCAQFWHLQDRHRLELWCRSEMLGFCFEDQGLAW